MCVCVCVCAYVPSPVVPIIRLPLPPRQIRILDSRLRGLKEKKQMHHVLKEPVAPAATSLREFLPFSFWVFALISFRHLRRFVIHPASTLSLKNNSSSRLLSMSFAS